MIADGVTGRSGRPPVPLNLKLTTIVNVFPAGTPGNKLDGTFRVVVRVPMPICEQGFAGGPPVPSQ